MFLTILLCILFFIKHYLADRVFQTYQTSVGKRLEGLDGYYNLFIHSAHHGILTVAIMLIYGIITQDKRFYIYLSIPILDFIFHFLIDKGKVIVEQLLNIQYQSNSWLILLTTDQTLHGLTYILIIWLLLRSYYDIKSISIITKSIV